MKGISHAPFHHWSSRKGEKSTSSLAIFQRTSSSRSRIRTIRIPIKLCRSLRVIDMWDDRDQRIKYSPWKQASIFSQRSDRIAALDESSTKLIRRDCRHRRTSNIWCLIDQTRLMISALFSQWIRTSGWRMTKLGSRSMVTTSCRMMRGKMTSRTTCWVWGIMSIWMTSHRWPPIMTEAAMRLPTRILSAKNRSSKTLTAERAMI